MLANIDEKGLKDVEKQVKNSKGNASAKFADKVVKEVAKFYRLEQIHVVVRKVLV